jgi:hypothetical protein
LRLSSAHTISFAAISTLVVPLALSGCGGLAPSARDLALDRARGQIDQIHTQLGYHWSAIPLSSFETFISEDGLELGMNTIGWTDEQLSETAFDGSGTIVHSARVEGDEGIVGMMLTAAAYAGGGDQYDDSYIYSCFEMSVSMGDDPSPQFDDAPCPDFFPEGENSALEKVSVNEID